MSFISKCVGLCFDLWSSTHISQEKRCYSHDRPQWLAVIFVMSRQTSLALSFMISVQTGQTSSNVYRHIQTAWNKAHHQHCLHQQRSQVTVLQHKQVIKMVLTILQETTQQQGSRRSSLWPQSFQWDSMQEHGMQARPRRIYSRLRGTWLIHEKFLQPFFIVKPLEQFLVTKCVCIVRA